ncbi:hypothetical protein [Nocardia terpenica]|uniref:hypothetical protein n=1 Tax=Nocardia terpenica TaxID=455432 RepID=UPI000B29AE3C|nr:hypothetical protein [Nocardia terpenica]NQE88492.1 hypothetical protein [Nocardia terpenica]
MDDSIDADALLAAGIDPRDPQEWETQWRMKLLLTLRAVQLGMREIDPDDPTLRR